MADSRLSEPFLTSRGLTTDETSPSSGFAALGLPAVLVDALAARGIAEPFPIQTATMPDALAGRDVLGCGRTGSGKTLAFVLPVIARLAATPGKANGRRPRALILAPTRELARQILEVTEPLAAPFGLTSIAVFGGVPAKPQMTAFRRGVDIVVACPGRMEDLVSSGAARLGDIEVTVLDEADHMADLGFLPSVRRLLDQTPKDGQRLLFSATLDAAVDVVVRRYLSNPVTHRVDPESTPVAEMAHHVLHISSGDRLPVLVELADGYDRSVVFTRTKHRARQLARQLVAAGVPAVEMHGNLSQPARLRNLNAFMSGEATALVATDIAARGLHIDDVEIVIHADPPVEHKAYLHRSGRTARAGAVGTVITLATEQQRDDVAKLGRKAGISPSVVSHRPGHPVLGQLGIGSSPSSSAAGAATASSSPAAPSRSATSDGKGGGGRRRRRRPRGKTPGTLRAPTGPRPAATR